MFMGLLGVAIERRRNWASVSGSTRFSFNVRGVFGSLTSNLFDLINLRATNDKDGCDSSIYVNCMCYLLFG